MIKASGIKKTLNFNDRMSVYGLAKEQEKTQSSSSDKNLVELDVSDLIEDPDNLRIYGDYNSGGLSEAIIKDGFTEAIVAYPYNGKYRVQSGHRRLSAAKKANLSKVHVIVVKAPTSDSERIRRLIASNLHERKITPMIIAREAKELMDINRKELSKLSEKVSEGEVHELTAKDLELSVSHLSKYLSLLELTPKLQRVINNEEISWSALIGAKKLTTAQQESLATWISLNPTATRNDIVERIDYMSHLKLFDDEEYEEKRSKTKELLNGIWEEEAKLKEKIDKENNTEHKADVPKKKINGAIRIKKSSDLLKECLSENARFKKKEIPNVIKELNSMKEMIDKKISELSNLN